MKHDERCKECKTKVFEMLEAIYGKEYVIKAPKLNLNTKIEDIKPIIYEGELKKIFKALQEVREFTIFIRAKKMRPGDFFVKDKFYLEFDESQHFTEQRLIALKRYPKDFKFGYDKNKWISLCEKLNKHDPDKDTPFRDEQRAWYDTLRDFAAVFLDLEPTKRLFVYDYEWCSLDPKSSTDIKIFKKLLGV